MYIIWAFNELKVIYDIHELVFQDLTWLRTWNCCGIRLNVSIFLYEFCTNKSITNSIHYSSRGLSPLLLFIMLAVYFSQHKLGLSSLTHLIVRISVTFVLTVAVGAAVEFHSPRRLRHCVVRSVTIVNWLKVSQPHLRLLTCLTPLSTRRCCSHQPSSLLI